MNVSTVNKKRTTIYAAFSADGVPALNVWDFNRKRLEVLVADRIANGEAFPGEHIVRCTTAFYRSVLNKHGMPLPFQDLVRVAR